MNVIDLHSKVWAGLQARRKQLPHSLLFVGQKGLGKYELARRFAASLLCESPSIDGLACGKCLACNWFEQGNHPDFRLLQPDALGEEAEVEDGKKKPSQQITIDQVRGLDEFFNVGTHRGGLRIILVNPTEAMNRSTANSLLKTLEEPAPDTLFLMVSSEPMRLLPTIRSRCQVVPVPVPSMKLAVKVLADDGVAEAERWLALAGGSPGLAMELARSGQGAWLELLTARLGAGRKGDPLAIAAELEKAIKDSKGRVALKHITEALQKWMVDLTLARNGLPVRYFLPQQAIISGLADMIPPARLIRSYRALITRRQEAEQPLNARLFLESLLLDYRALFAN
ncbi:MAG: DNA polymerase III subunit delta' [Gammaproteobacteria bacterium]|nr:DNA polymerase III subunit delta' [Gammaproteobacteria bacterium]MBU1603222.1 DNA polymerase III subunit delta' [Gammaproteobacteria bacterium]MBU2432742.1 DNA polymerase III subunit delta' [Gammaproteobacteria bacterium]MBU2451573.1 DNA polymerase III subunit delta' [Gammaproteobacteria bacterium]